MTNTPKTDANFSAHALEQVVPQLDNLSTLDLAKLRDMVNTKITQVQHREREQALRQIQEIATTVGMSVPAIMAFKLEGSTVAYRNPNNSRETWRGKGARPKWVKDWLELGGTMDQIRVDK